MNQTKTRSAILFNLPMLLIVVGSSTLAMALFGFITAFPAVINDVHQYDFTCYYMGTYVLNHDHMLYRELYPTVEPRIKGLPYSPYIYPPFFASILRPLAIGSG